MADASAIPTDHARHDALLVAAHAAGDLDPAADARARDLIADCPACADLATDLRALASATTAVDLPVPARPRSFTLDVPTAARLRPSGWRGLLRRFASPSFAFTRPLAAGLTTLGLAGLIAASLPGLGSYGPEVLGPAGGAAAPSDVVPEYGAPAASPGAPSLRILTDHATSPAASPEASSDATRSATPTIHRDSAASALPPDDAAGGATGQPPTGLATPSWFVAGSLGALLAGLALFGLRRLAAIDARR